MLKYIILLILAISHSFEGACQQSKYDSLWNDQAIQQRIEKGIEQNRKGEVIITVSQKGKALAKNVRITITQQSHHFLFGTTLFMANGFDTPEKNNLYSNALTSLFNHGSVPFYWEALEPEQGKLRFEKNSSFVYRRPPPDAALEFARKHGIYPKGHTLVWDNIKWSVPRWLPDDSSQIDSLINNRITQIAKRYGDKIDMWDVVNEINNRDTSVHFSRDFALKAFQHSAKVFPPETKLLINETTSVWFDKKREYANYYQVIENLLLKGAKIDGIGLQCHFFHGDEEFKQIIAGNIMQPLGIFDVLDNYQHFNRPLHITEVTIPTIPDNSEGQELQAKVARNLYRLWFSHPSVASIVWWNMIDNTAAAGEDRWRGGFLDKNFQPKKSYAVLDQLINKEWRSDSEFMYDGHPKQLRVFYGRYAVTVNTAGKKYSFEFTCEPGKMNRWEITL